MGRRGRGRGRSARRRRPRPGGLGSERLAQHGQQHDGQRQAGKPQCDKPPAALLAAARRRTCAAHGARAGHGRISVRPRLLHAGRSLSPALGRDTPLAACRAGRRARPPGDFSVLVCTHTALIRHFLIVNTQVCRILYHCSSYFYLKFCPNVLLRIACGPRPVKLFSIQISIVSEPICA
jgi:hypothetical protein